MPWQTVLSPRGGPQSTSGSSPGHLISGARGFQTRVGMDSRLAGAPSCPRCPDERRHDPEVAPMERVDDEAVDDDPAPGGEQRGGADSLGVTAGNGIGEGSPQCEDHERRKAEETRKPLLGNGPYVGAVRGDRGDVLELSRPDPERVALRRLEPRDPGAEAISVVPLELRA